MDRVPAKLGTFGRYAFITRDTALFQGMARAMQYGDFLAKAVLHDHLKAQGRSQEEALKGITEEFVNYNLLSGRTQQYAANMGLIWFWPFKIRSMYRAARRAYSPRGGPYAMRPLAGRARLGPTTASGASRRGLLRRCPWNCRRCRAPSPSLRA